jgi:hypothetical protein
MIETKAPVRRGIHRRAAMTAVLILFLGMMAATDVFVGKASAAGLTTKPDIYGCFVWGAYGVPYANQPVHLQAWYDVGGWKVTRTTTTNANGCVRFNDITVHRYYRLAAPKPVGALIRC